MTQNRKKPFSDKGTLGRHVLVELYECSAELINDVLHIEESMLNAAREAEATIINSTFHHFSPFGVSGVVVIQESHLSIHTWPEYRYAAIDVFTCGESIDPWIPYEYMKKALKAKHGSTMEMKRGQTRLLPRVEFTQAFQSGDPYFKAPKSNRNIWFTERDENLALSLRHTGNVLFRQKSKFQKVEVYDTFQYGKMLTLDGMIMTTEKDEYVYHEIITHPALIMHPEPKQVLVIGGGDGGVVKEVVKHDSVEKVTMVEIDSVVVDASRKFLPSISCALDHPKVELIIDDGIKFIKNSKSETYDVIIVDSTDPVGPAAGIFTKKFYTSAYRILTSNGIFTSQCESPWYNIRVFQEIFRLLKSIYGKKKVHTYLGSIASYPSGTWAFSFCSKGSIHPLANFQKDKSRDFTSKHELRYYSDEMHVAAFALPPYVKQLLHFD